jgi:hypothetical protein
MDGRRRVACSDEVGQCPRPYISAREPAPGALGALLPVAAARCHSIMLAMSFESITGSLLYK